MSPGNSHQKVPDDLALQRVESYFARNASTSIAVNRNEQDSYAIYITPEGHDRTPYLIEADAIALLPAGSRWLPAVGWHSYFGIPFRFDGEMWLALGAEYVKQHHSRGATVSFLAFTFPLHSVPLRSLEELANELQSSQSVADRAKARRSVLDRAAKVISDGLGKLRLHDSRYRVVNAGSRTPAEHVGVETRIIREAIESYGKRESLLFRTLILSENELPRSPLTLPRNNAQSLNRLRIDYQKYLAATVPALRGILSSRTRHF